VTIVADRRADAEALWYVAPNKAEIRREPVPAAADGEVRVRALFSALSRGTERLVFTGRVPESEHQRMRAPFMGGAFPFPVKYGYSLVGRVEAGVPDLVGRTVFALHPHQSVFTLKADAVIPVPPTVPPSRAVLAANMETALNAVWDAAAGRAALARALGVGFAPPFAAPEDCDLVVHASGNGAGLATALGLAGTEATVLELSWFGTGDVKVPLGGAFHSRRLKLVASQVGRVAPSRRPRWTSRRRLAAALDLLSDPRLDALLAPAVAFRDLPARLGHILAPDSAVLCQVVDYS